MEAPSTDREPRIDRVEGDLMAVNSYVVHGPDGLVVVDGQLTGPDAAKVRAVVDGIGRPVAGLVVTHPHPDHYAGAARLLDGLDVPIYATAAVDAVIRRDDAEKDAIVGPMMGDAWPQDRRFPDTLAASGATVEIGGLTFTVTDLGPAESHADTLWRLGERTVFVGDVAYNRMHAYLADGRHRSWLAVLDDLAGSLPAGAVLYPGHGPPTGPEVLAEQHRYVEAFVAAVAAAADLAPEDRRAAVVAAMREVVDDGKLEFLMELSIDPVLASLAEPPA